MTKLDFIEYLSHPEKLNGHSIDALEKLVQQYPYFQIGRMLYLKNLHNENNIDYEKNIHITSAYAPNNKVLYNLIKKKAIRRSPEETKKEELKDAAMEVLPVLSKTVISESEILPKLEPIAILEELTVISTEAPAAYEEIKQDDSDEMQVLEKQMLREAYRTSMTVDLIGETDPGHTMEGITEVSPPFSKDPSPLSESYSFGDWLKIVGEKPLIKQVQNADGELKIPKKNKTEIIDNFLLEETSKSVQKPKAAFYSADAMAKKSLRDDENFVSETLAKIYLKQGNLSKAKRIYEILLVKHPEKIHIFAPLLEKIKELIKQQSPSRLSGKEGKE